MQKAATERALLTGALPAPAPAPPTCAHAHARTMARTAPAVPRPQRHLTPPPVPVAASPGDGAAGDETRNCGGALAHGEQKRWSRRGFAPRARGGPAPWPSAARPALTRKRHTQHPEAFCPPVSLDISTRGYRSLRPWTLGLGTETRHPQQPLRRREKHGSSWEPGRTSRPRPVAPLVTSRQVHEAGQVSRGASCFACARRRNTSRGRAACAARSGPCGPTRNGQTPLAVGMVAAAAERGRALGDPRPGGPAPRGPAPLQSPLRAEDRLVFLPPQMLR